MADNDLKVPNYEGRRTFDFIFQQVQNCFVDLVPFFLDINPEDIYTAEYYPVGREISENRPSIDLKLLAHCDISYNIVFFGLGYGDVSILNRLFKKYYNSAFISCILFYITKKPHPDSGRFDSWRTFNKLLLPDILEKLQDVINAKAATFTFVPNPNLIYNPINSLQENFFKYYGGHQFKLGHYYRHLFQSVKYINEQKKLNYSEKYEYIKTLRAQLSTPEQYLLFFNSISTIGRDWELNHLKGNTCEVNSYLITKYNLIKNIPDWFVFDRIDVRQFYPDVTFESIDINQDRIKLNSQFK